MERQFFFNCTLPRFCTLCQYSFDIYEIIYNYYQQEYNPTELTCYTHLLPFDQVLWKICNGAAERDRTGCDAE